MSPRDLTSSDLLGFGVSSAFFSIFGFRLSLLDGRVGLSASAALLAGRLAVGVLPLTVREPDDMLECAACCAPLAVFAVEEVMDDDEVFGLVVGAGGVGEGRSMVARHARTAKREEKKFTSVGNKCRLPHALRRRGSTVCGSQTSELGAAGQQGRPERELAYCGARPGAG